VGQRAKDSGDRSRGQEMKVIIVIPFINDYVRCENGEPLEFNSIRDMLLYLANRNFSIAELLEFDYEVEE
jgi:hypothetical protein